MKLTVKDKGLSDIINKCQRTDNMSLLMMTSRIKDQSSCTEKQLFSIGIHLKTVAKISDNGTEDLPFPSEEIMTAKPAIPERYTPVSFLFKLKIQYITAIICLSRLIKPDCMNYIMPLNISYNLVSYDVSKGIILASPAPLIIV